MCTVVQVSQDALSGLNFVEPMRDRTQEAGRHLLHVAINHLSQSGSGIR